MPAASGSEVAVHPLRLRAAGALPPPVEVLAVPGIEREGRHAGKFKLIQTTVRREHAHDRDHASA